MFDTYIKNTEDRKKKYKTNDALQTLISCIARKYPVVKSTKRKSKKSLVLYDRSTKSVNEKNTMRFIASETTKFVREIRRTGLPGDNAARYVSIRQIRYLKNENSGKTSLNSVLLLIVMIKLLQYDNNSSEYRALIDEDSEDGMNIIHPCSPDMMIRSHPDPSVNCSEFFLGQLFKNIQGNCFPIKPTQQYLANYLIASSERLDELVTDDVYDAIRIGNGYPNKKCEFKDIIPNQMYDFPG